jgi:hypothetical protein
MKNTPPLVLANKIIKIFIDEKIPLSQQLEVIKMVKERIEFCKKTGAEIKQLKLDL